MTQTYLETLRKFVLLLIYYTESEVDLIGLVKVGLNLHDLGERLLGIVVAAISIIENTNTVPEHGVLQLELAHGW
jgi:hypothetical protein